MSVFKILLKLLVVASVVGVAGLLLQHWIETKQYVFDKEDIAKLAKQYAGEFVKFGIFRMNCSMHFFALFFNMSYILLLFYILLPRVCFQGRIMSRPSPKWWWS